MFIPENHRPQPAIHRVLPDAMSGLVEQLGEDDFPSRFLGWLNTELGVEQCMLFFCDARHEVSSLLHRDVRGDASARSLAQAYVEDRHYRRDPNYACLSDCADDELHVFHFDHLRSSMKPSYRQYFFEKPGFRDKLSIIRGHEGGNYYLNLYRRDGDFHALFSNAEEEAQAARLMSSLLIKHYQLMQQKPGRGPLALLSLRERQVCEAILQGKQSELIASELRVSVNSVITYRKRAYEKLGISRRAQLFALCQ